MSLFDNPASKDRLSLSPYALFQTKHEHTGSCGMWTLLVMSDHVCSEIRLQASGPRRWDVIFVQRRGTTCLLSTDDPRRSDWLRLFVSIAARGYCLRMPETRDHFT